MPAPGYLFVYGTLRKNSSGRVHPFLQHRADYLATASISGKLYNLQNYPGAIPCQASSQRVHGEIYRLHDAETLLQTLDKYEECATHFPAPHEYRRCRMPVTLPDNRSLIAWVYLYNRPVAGLEPIPCGDYHHYLQSKQGLSDV